MHQQSGMGMNNNMNMNNNLDLGPQKRFNPSLGNDGGGGQPEESLIPADPNYPLKELEYDDRVDHAAEVSVMDSIGGPSLLLENLRNASKIVKTVSPEIIQKFGANCYPQELGLTSLEKNQFKLILVSSTDGYTSGKIYLKHMNLKK